MSSKRPINADEPAKPRGEASDRIEKEAAKPVPETIAKTEAKANPAPSPPPPPRAKRERRSIPGAVKGILALVAIAIVFIVVAVIGGSGGSGDEQQATPAPAPSASAPAEESEGSGEDQSGTELGYPAFATNNTTRIGGADAAANAAAIALAVFPSTTSSQRPAAVTLVNEDDWAGAVAGAVLMAEPVRAPLLVSGDDELPEPSAEALAVLAPPGTDVTKGAGAFAIGEVASLEGGKVTHVKGGNPAARAAAVAALRDRLFGSPPAHVVLAPSGQPAFALPAAAWAARSGDPVLYAEGDQLPEETVAYLKKHADVPVYVLGPHTAISSKATREVAKIGNQVHRVSAEDPVANALAFARFGDGSFGWNVNDPGHGFVLARDDSPLEAAVAAPLSASGTWGPLLLTDSATTLPKPLHEYFLDVKPGYTTNPTRAFYNHVWVIGDQEAIDVNQQAEVNELAELAKIGGAG